MASSKNRGQFGKKHRDEEGLGVLEEAQGWPCPWDVHLQPNQILGMFNAGESAPTPHTPLWWVQPSLFEPWRPLCSV